MAELLPVIGIALSLITAIQKTAIELRHSLNNLANKVRNSKSELALLFTLIEAKKQYCYRLEAPHKEVYQICLSVINKDLANVQMELEYARDRSKNFFKACLYVLTTDQTKIDSLLGDKQTHITRLESLKSWSRPPQEEAQDPVLARARKLAPPNGYQAANDGSLAQGGTHE